MTTRDPKEQAAIDALGLGGLTLAEHQAKYRAGPGQPQPCQYCNRSGPDVIPFGIGPWTWLHQECWQMKQIDETVAKIFAEQG